MKMRIGLFLLCAALALSPVAHAENGAIKGAFGFWFGETLDTSGKAPVFRGDNGVRAYAVESPPSPYGAFSRYTVYVTEDDRIYEIAGDGRMDSSSACIDELLFMTEVVAAKYPGAARLASEGTLIRRTVLRKGHNLVEIVCLDEDIAIRYRDDGVLTRPLDARLAKGAQEGRPAETRERDTSGL
ncbi:MAG: hypothetical protein WED00_11270 [Aquisalimonadaceae bacterium]